MKVHEVLQQLNNLDLDAEIKIKFNDPSDPSVTHQKVLETIETDGDGNVVLGHRE